MYIQTPTLITISLLLSFFPATSLATPTSANNPFFYQPLTLTLHSGTFSYTLSIAADGQTYPTNNNWNISSISSAPPFDLASRCRIYTSPTSILAPERNADGSVTIDPAQIVTSFNCQPTPGGGDTCLPVYASCQWEPPTGGVILLNCCSGYCAASKCRATS